VLLDPVPAGPLLALLAVGLAGVHLRAADAEGLGDGLDPLPVLARPRVEVTGLLVLTGGVETGELLGLLHQLVGLVGAGGGVVALGLRGGGGAAGVDLAVLRGLGGEVGADALALHPRLAGGDVVCLRHGHDEVAVEVGADGLYLAGDALAGLSAE